MMCNVEPFKRGGGGGGGGGGGSNVAYGHCDIMHAHAQ